MKEIDIFSIKTAHLVGIKGVAMASLAQCLDDMGVKITGSDVPEDFVTKGVLSQRSFQIFEGFKPANISKDVELVVYTGAHQGKNNPEVKQATNLNIPVMSHAQALGEIMKGKKGISVCGTGGKSTTSAMIAWILDQVGAKPSFSVGVGNVNNFGTTGRYTQINSEETDEISRSGWFVAEADEYAVDPTSDHRPRFIYQNPEAIICTHLSYDHPDIYPSFDKMKETFATFFSTAESVYINADCKDLKDLFEGLREKNNIHYESCSIGFEERADYRITLLQSEPGKTKFQVAYEGHNERQPFLFQTYSWRGELKIPGKHNVRNAVLAMVTAMNEVGIEPQAALNALAQFEGTMRRFEHKGKLNGVSLYDDYAHTPDEIAETIQALREWEPGKKVIVAFQPHTFSRTKALFDGFVKALSEADHAIVLDIFPSAREDFDSTISSKMITEKISEENRGKVVTWCEDVTALKYAMLRVIKEGDVFITMGAGDIYKVYDALKLEK